MSITGLQKDLLSFKNKIQSIRIDVLLSEIIQEEQKFIIDLNQSQLYDYGITGEGSAVRPSYQPFTIKIKKSKGQKFSHVTLKDLGDFYKSFKVQQTESIFFINALDPKTRKLISKYGRDILGLTDENLQKFINFVDLKLRKKINNLLNDKN